MSEKAQVEQVFALTGGELCDEPWLAKDSQGREWKFHFWYEFPPEYAEKDFDSTAFSFRTVVRDNMFGLPPEHLDRWTRVAVFRSSGETECPGRNGDDKAVIEDECSLCEGKCGEEHGHIYIGDGWAEVIYREEA